MKFIILLLSFLFTTSAFAETIAIKTSANRETEIDYIGFFFKDSCTSAALPQIKFEKQPEHGTIRVRESKSPLPKSSGKCAGKVTNELYLYYKPQKGYRGKDLVKIKYYVRGSGKWISGNKTYKIQVD